MSKIRLIIKRLIILIPILFHFLVQYLRSLDANYQNLEDMTLRYILAFSYGLYSTWGMYILIKELAKD